MTISKSTISKSTISKSGKNSTTTIHDLFPGMFPRRMSAEEMERHAREEKIRDLLPDEEDDSINKLYDARLTGRLIGYLKPYRGMTVWALILMSIASIFHTIAPWLIGRAIDDGLRINSLANLRWWTVAFLVVTVGEWAINYKRIDLMAFVGT